MYETKKLHYELLKKFNEQTIVNKDDFSIYRKKDNGVTIAKKGVLLDNRYIVQYNRHWLIKFDAHINVKYCNHSRCIEYLFKYVNKGSDKVTTIIEKCNSKLSKC